MPVVTVEVENMGPIPVPLRRSADGTLVADWGQVPARVYVAGVADSPPAGPPPGGKNSEHLTVTTL